MGADDLKARNAALFRDIARLLGERGAPAGMRPSQAAAAGLVTLTELNQLAQLHGVRIGADGRSSRRDHTPRRSPARPLA